ncbi:hypothetical protein ABPG77_009454 [Micractinium sp. CCAP 211/92]
MGPRHRGVAKAALLLLAAAQVALVAAGRPGAIQVSADIYQGVPAPAGVFDFMVRILLPTSDGNGGTVWTHACGGSLISPTAVLTAAHCVVIEPEGLLPADVFLLENRGVAYTASGVIVHPNYNASALEGWNQDLHDDKYVTLPPPNYDLAVIQLATAVPNPVLIQLPSPDLQLMAGEVAEVAGWGRTDGSDTSPASDTLLYAQLQLAAPFDWNNPPVPGTCPMPSFPDMICALNTQTGANACAGDSGGPLFLRDYTSSTGNATIIGIVSNGPSCSDVDYGFYTDVRDYTSEIQVWIAA